MLKKEEENMNNEKQQNKEKKSSENHVYAKYCWNGNKQNDEVMEYDLYWTYVFVEFCRYVVRNIHFDFIRNAQAHCAPITTFILNMVYQLYILYFLYTGICPLAVYWNSIQSPRNKSRNRDKKLIDLAITCK